MKLLVIKIGGRVYKLIEKEDLDELFKMLRERYEVGSDLFDEFLRRLEE